MTLFSGGRTLGTAALLASLYSTTVLAADPELDMNSLPAVSGINGKIDFSYMYLDTGTVAGDISGGVAVGSLTFPVAHRFGLQVDAGFGRFNSSTAAGDIDTAGIGAHFFARDPEMGLIGLYGHYVKADFAGIDLYSYKYGVEAEYYLNQLSFEAFAGAENVRANGNSESYASLDFTAAYYVNDNFRVDAGVSHQFDETLGKVGFEAALPIFSNNTSLYANASFGNDGHGVRAGIKIYLGADDGKSLKDRHRQDDPPERMMNFNGLDLSKFEDPKPMFKPLPPKYKPVACGEYGGRRMCSRGPL